MNTKSRDFKTDRDRIFCPRQITGTKRLFGSLRNSIGPILITMLMMVIMAGCGLWDGSEITGGSDKTAPTVSSTVPVNAATGVAINTAISATFSEAMDPSSISTATFTVKQGTSPVSGTVTYAGLVATFKPAANLAVNTTYTATITSGVTDLAGNAMEHNYVWSFTTGNAPDAAPPTVISTDPVNLATNVALNKKITATFSEAMDPLTVTAATFTLKRGTTPVSGTVTYTGMTGTFTPAANLASNTTYTATITTGVEDLAGNAMAVNYVWSFTTGAAPDAVLPTVISTDPANLAVNVALNKKIVATFSETMDPVTITTATFTLQQGTTPVAGTVTYAGTAGTFTPAANLAANTTYTATITTGAKDLAGNAMAVNYVWSFTTGAGLDAVPPTVISTDPENNATGVPLNQFITAFFSEAMDPLTITTVTYTLKQGLTPVSGTVSYAGTGGTFVPEAGLAANTTYTATITTGAKDLAGNAMASDYVWQFTTGAALPPPGPAMVNLGCASGFPILAGSTVTNTGNTIVNGDLGLSPGSAVTGFPPGIVNGTIRINDAEVNNAKSCLTSAYNDAAGRAPGAAVSGNIGGQTLTPGVYTSTSTLAISSGDLTLDAQGNSEGVFIFQIPSSLTVTSGRQVILAGGAQAKNVFWQVGTSATIGTTAAMKGTIMADQSVTLETGASLVGRAMTRIAAVTLDFNAVTNP